MKKIMVSAIAVMLFIFSHTYNTLHGSSPKPSRREKEKEIDCSALTTLNLSNKGIKSFKTLFSIESSQTKIIDLSNNKIESVTPETLRDIEKAFPMLETINLTGNNIKKASLLALWLEQNPLEHTRVKLEIYNSDILKKNMIISELVFSDG